MSKSPKRNYERLQRVLNAWETLRADKSFAGLTLAQFKTKVQPSLDARTELAQLRSQLTGAKAARHQADVATEAAIQAVVHAVQSDLAEGSDGEFYAAMGYVRRSDRRSGLTRGRRSTDTTTTNVTPIAA